MISTFPFSFRRTRTLWWPGVWPGVVSVVVADAHLGRHRAGAHGVAGAVCAQAESEITALAQSAQDAQA